MSNTGVPKHFFLEPRYAILTHCLQTERQTPVFAYENYFLRTHVQFILGTLVDIGDPNDTGGVVGSGRQTSVPNFLGTPIDVRKQTKTRKNTGVPAGSGQKKFANNGPHCSTVAPDVYVFKLLIKHDLPRMYV